MTKDFVIGRDCVGVGALIINHAGEFLLGKRGPAARNEKGLWDFPGGGVEHGETLEDAVIREVREEHGIRIAVSALVGVIDHFVVAENEHWVSAVYLCTMESGVAHIQEPDKCSEIGWFSAEEIAELALTQSSQNAWLLYSRKLAM